MPFDEIGAAEAHAKLDHFRVIDVREQSEFDGPLGHIDYAELVPLSTLEECAPRLAGQRPLLMVCRSGRRSGVACEMLQELGVENAVNLAGGMIGWHRAGLPTGRNEPRSLPALVDEIVTWAAQVGPLSKDAACEIAREQLARSGSSIESPSHAAVDALLGFVGESLEIHDPPDLDLCLSAFRRSLAVL